jgi:sugar lactone lactonase YvrE
VAPFGTGALLLLGSLLANTEGMAQESIPPDTVTTVRLSVPLDGFGNLGGVTVDALGFVYVANFRDGVWRISPDGEAKRLTDALYGSSGNAVDARGVLYQSNFNGNSIVKVGRDGSVEPFVAEGLAGPVGLTFGGDGALYVCNCSGNSISRVTPEGDVEEFVKDPLLNCPNGITTDEAGALYVVNFNSPDVVRITPEGTAERFARVSGAGGNGHITFSRGSFYITQFRGHSVWRVSRDGRSVTRIAGDGTREIRDGTAEYARFSYPNGIATAAGGRVLWINDLEGETGSGERTAIRLRRVRLVTLGDVVTAALEGADDAAAAAERAYASYRAARPGEETITDAIQTGYQLMSRQQTAAGLTLFRLNAEDHSGVAAARYHLGEAYRFTGQNAQAAAEYRAVLELEPDHAQALDRLALIERGGADPF